jgi:hypothetical protein
MYHKGHTTKYKGIRFRSRLEATWAAFFDLLEWKWEYEPVDLNGWVPDFGLIKKDGTFFYVEVKPYMIEDDWEKEKKIKIDKPVLCLNAAPCEDIAWGDAFRIGFIANDMSADFDPACLGKVKESFLPEAIYDYDFFGFYGSYKYRLNEIHDGDGHLDIINYERGFPVWARAKNIVQWIP